MLKTWDTPYHRVYTSPLSRAQHTGEYIAESLGLPIDTHDDLIEGFLGDWEGITYQQLSDFGFAKHSIRDDNFRGHNGESPNQLAERMANVLEEIRAQHPGENIIFVSHGAAIAHLLIKHDARLFWKVHGTPCKPFSIADWFRVRWYSLGSLVRARRLGTEIVFRNEVRVFGRPTFEQPHRRTYTHPHAYT